MQMQYRSVCMAIAVVCACGDNHKLVPDGGLPDTGGNGPEACGLQLDAASLSGSWDPRFTIPGFIGPDGHSPTLYDFARDVDGSIVAAGEFRYLGGTHVEPLMRLRDGVWQPARTTWELEPPGSGFSAIAIDAGGRLALATYDDFGTRSGEIWLDDGTGLRVIGTFDGMIRKLHWFGGKLWAAGWTQLHEGSAVIQGLAVWDGSAWAAPPSGAMDGFAYELVEDGSELLVGGVFSQLGGLTTSAVAAFDGTTWRPLDFPGVGVYALARGPDGELYAGGAFGEFADGAGGLARWDGKAWVEAAGGVYNRSFPGVVTDLVDHAGSLYVSGCFRTVGGIEDATTAIVSRDVARFDGAWHSLDDDTRGVSAPWLEPRRCGDEGFDTVWDVSKQALFSAGDQVLLAGSFSGIAGTLSQAVIGYDGTAWRAQGTTGLGIGGSIDRIAASATCDLWGTGRMSHIAGVATRAHVVHFTGTGWQPIADTIPSDAFCPGFAVSPGGDIVLGCQEAPPDGDAVGRIYKVAGDQLVQLGPDQPLIQTVTYSADGTLWIAGGAATGWVARLDGDVFTTVEAGFDGPILQLDVAGPSDVLVAGTFTHVGGVAASRIARWNGTAWTALGTGLPGVPTALARDATTVYASTVDEGTGAGALLLGAFDGTAWRELATPAAGLTSVPYFNFNAIHAINGAVIAVGTAELDDKSGRGALVYRAITDRFTPLGGGVHAMLLSGLAVTRDAVWVAGLIAEAGAAGATTPSVGVARYVIAR